MKKLIILFTYLLFNNGFTQNHMHPLYKGNTTEKYIAFTFDDGPVTGITEEILNLFAQYQGKATFFQIGELGTNHPELVKLVLEQGHEIGNHTEHHQRISEIADMQYLQCEITCLQDYYWQHFQYSPKLFRAPFLDYGHQNNKEEIDETLKKTLASFNLRITNASVFSKDTQAKITWPTIYQNINSKIHPGAIILCHELPQTVAALKRLLPDLTKQGYQFVTVSQLVNLDHFTNQ